MVLKLDPRIPILWRDPSTVQLGADPVVAVIPDVSAGLERLLAIVQAGVSESGFAMFASTFGVTPRQAQRLRDALAPALMAPVEGASEGPRVLVAGAGPLATEIARIVHALGLLTSDESAARLVVLVADHVVPPADHRRWLHRDVSHLPVVVGEAAISVGPLVVPGRSACLHCVGLHRRDADPAWPAIASQLTTTPSAPSPPVRAAAAAAHVTRLVAAVADGQPVAAEEAVRIAGDGSVLSVQRFEPHPACRCAAPQESDWAREDAREDLPPPSAARVFAVHG